MKTVNEEQNTLSLKELIRRVQQELVDSQKEREEKGDDALFEVEKLTLEVNFVVTRSNDAKGSLDFKVLTVGGISLGGGKNYQQQQVHKIILSLKAIPDKPKKRIIGGGGAANLPGRRGFHPAR
ncbi:MAG TPA: trypco2 family protein [Pyrinomonadaceae bacterium]|nr:trypco2 family protein [Pyrinomonadaceae bacterium]